MVSIRVNDVSLVYRLPRKFSLASQDRRLGNAGGQIDAQKGRIQTVKALDGVSFELSSGDRLGLVGPNGAGKTTLLKVLYGIYEPTSGDVAVTGRMDALFNINLGFRREATGRRNIELRGLINGWSTREIDQRMDDIVDFSELGDFIDMPFKAYSQGMAARLAFSIATSFNPEILLMDEWIGAGDPAFREKAGERMKQMCDNAAIVIIASHSMALLERTCSKILELERGTLRRFEPVETYFAERS
jgi:ABC-type polysaccharide/polyol phosphate transport system ATPase subunit